MGRLSLFKREATDLHSHYGPVQLLHPVTPALLQQVSPGVVQHLLQVSPTTQNDRAFVLAALVSTGMESPYSLTHLRMEFTPT